jgi:hypothetical protein
MQGDGLVPFAVVLNNIRRSFPGQLSDVQQQGPFYRVKWLTPDGRVLFIDADARSGQILGVSGGGPAPGQAPLRQNRDRNVDIMRRPDVGPPNGDAFERPAPRQQQPLPRGRGRGGRFGPGEED